MNENQNSSYMHELKTHGQLTFPFTVYKGNIPEYITSYPLHWHEELELIYIIKGQGLFTVESKKYECSNGDLLVILPGEIHSISQYENASMEYFNILFKLTLLEDNQNSICYQKYFLPLLTQQKAVSAYVPSASALNHALQPYILFLIENRKSAASGLELLVKANLYSILHHLNQSAITISTEELSKTNTFHKLKPILSYIKNNYSTDISIKQASKTCGFSESHFMKIFKSLTGKTFTQYLILYRLEIAASELKSGNKKIIEIAEDSGFRNISYFIRCFAKKYGVSPSEYRRKYHHT